MLWNGVEYFQRWTKLDLENVDDIVLCKQKERLAVNLLKGKKITYVSATNYFVSAKNHAFLYRLPLICFEICACHGLILRIQMY